MPSVAISSVMPSWLTSRPSTSFWISQASTIITQRGEDEGDRVGEELVVEAGQLRDPFGEARHRQRREQHHRALREVEDARGLVDQHEAERDQRIQHAGHQAAEQGFEERAHAALAQCEVPR